MIRILLLIQILFAFKVQSQDLNSEQLDVITRNILSYHFRYALNYDLNLKSDQLIQNGDYFFDELWPGDDQNLKLDVAPSKLQYPIKGVVIYELTKKGFQIGTDSIRISKKLTSFEADDIYLVAIDVSDKELKFISGNFFQSSIQDDFILNIKQPETFINYLTYRTFNWSTENIEYRNTKKGTLIFTAYSQYLKEYIRIEVDEADFDKVKVLRQKKKVTY